MKLQQTVGLLLGFLFSIHANAFNTQGMSTYWKLGLKNDPITIPNVTHHIEAIQLVVIKGNIGAYITNEIGDERKNFMTLGDAYGAFSAIYIVQPNEKLLLNFDFAFPTGANGYYQIADL